MLDYVLMNDVEKTSKSNGTNDACFICLEDSSNRKLKRCCTQCYALVHANCWLRWNNSRKMSAFKSMILGEAVNRETGICTICRSGSVNIEISDSDDDCDGKSVRDIGIIFEDRTIQTSFRVIFNRLYGRNAYSYYLQNGANDQELSQGIGENTNVHLFSGKTLLVNGLFFIFLGIYAFLNNSLSDNKSIITLSLWVYITFILQFLILTGINRRQVLNEFMIDEPSISDDYSTVDSNNNDTGGIIESELTEIR